MPRDVRGWAAQGPRLRRQDPAEQQTVVIFVSVDSLRMWGRWREGCVFKSTWQL